MDEKEKLKREISKRWPDRSPEARAQLEYILQEAGLLAKARKRRTTKTLPDIRHLLATEHTEQSEEQPQHTKD